MLKKVRAVREGVRPMMLTYLNAHRAVELRKDILRVLKQSFPKALGTDIETATDDLYRVSLEALLSTFETTMMSVLRQRERESGSMIAHG
jgi:hypothetical protein